MQKKPPRSIWARIEEALEEAGLPPTQKQAAAICSISQASVSDWNRAGSPELVNALTLAKRLNICVEWIYTERGPKRPGPPDDPASLRLWNAWGPLDASTRNQVVGYAEAKLDDLRRKTGTAP